MMSSSRFRNSGLKTRLALLQNLVPHRVVAAIKGGRTEAERGLFLDQFSTYIRGQNDDRVPEIDLATQSYR
jgi:hypothetical protein